MKQKHLKQIKKNLTARRKKRSGENARAALLLDTNTLLSMSRFLTIAVLVYLCPFFIPSTYRKHLEILEDEL